MFLEAILMAVVPRELTQGQRIPLRDLTASLRFSVEVDLRFSSSAVVDISSFGLDADGQLSDDRYFQFYNQRRSPCGSITLLDSATQGQQRCELDLACLPDGIRRLVFVASIDGDGRMGDLRSGYLRLLVDHREVGRFAFDGTLFADEKALMVGEIYWRDGWRFAAVGQGFSGGLSAVLRHFGGEEADEAPAGPSEACQSSVEVPPVSRHEEAAQPNFAPPWQPVGALMVDGKRICRQCGRGQGLLGSLGYNSQAGRCGSCDKEAKRGLRDFRQRCLFAMEDMARIDLDALESCVRSYRLDLNEAWAFVRGDVLAALERCIQTWAKVDLLDRARIARLYQVMSRTLLPKSMGEPLMQQVQDALAMQALQRFRQMFVAACEDGILTDDEWRELQGLVRREGLDLDRALASVQAEALGFMQRTLAIAAADGEITEAEEQDFHRLRQQLKVPAPLVQPLVQRLNELRTLTRLRRGELPTVTTNVRLESHEICHLETSATYRKVTARSVTPIAGRLIATSKQLHFLSPNGGWKIKLGAIMRVYHQGNAIHLELSNKTGNGRYDLADAHRVEAIIDALVRIEKRQLLVNQSDNPTRHIPHDVRRLVWQRDQGRCTQCQDRNYLEYDHIIPYSRGGANTVNNVQLLCRRCNLTKGDRI